MEEMMTMMMMIRSSPANPRNESISISEDPITNSTFPTWKLYENPFYYSQHPRCHQQKADPQEHKQLHRLHLPLSTRKIAASFWDLTFTRPFMDPGLDMAKAQIIELKAELEYERRTRKKVESANKKLARELSEERKGREALARVCEELAKEISSDKEEINRMKKEMEEERKMLRMAEVFREERVQMKLTDAKLLLEEKMLELKMTKRMQTECTCSSPKAEPKNQEEIAATVNNNADSLSVEPVRCFPGDQKSSTCNVVDSNWIANSLSIQRKASPEPENPHIKRGIKGFVEFPKVVRAIGSKSRHLGTKLECQKAQLRILLKHKCPIRSNNLIMS